MPVTPQVIPVVFSGGLDTKTDSKSVMPGRYTQLENATFTKPGVISKRYGYDVTTLAIDGGGGNLTAGAALSSFNDELLLWSGTSVYSYAAATDKWMSRGRATSVITAQTQVARNGYTQTNPDVAYLATSSTSGIYVHAWEDSRGGVRYSVQDSTTGAFYVSDVSVHTTAGKPKLVTFGSEIVLFYALGANLFYRRIAGATPTTLGAQVNPIATLATLNHYDVMVVGVKLWIVWNSTVGPVTKLAFLDTTYTLSALTSAMNAMPSCVSLWTDASSNIWVGGANATDVVVAAFSYASVAALAGSSIETIPRIQRVVGTVASGTSTATVFYEQLDAGNVGHLTKIRTNTISLAGIVGTAADFRRSVGLASKAFSYGGATYLCATFQTTFQPTLYVLNTSGDVVARLAPNTSGGLRTVSTVSEAPATATGVFAIAGLNAGLLAVQSGVLRAPTGVVRYSLDFTSTSRFLSGKLGNNLLFVGGLLQAYDGLSVMEHGFMQFPENVTATGGSSFGIVTVNGTAGTPEVDTVTLPAASRISGGQYWTLKAQGGTVYYVWYTVDGVGVDPVAAGTAIPIALNNYDDAAAVAAATKVGLDTHSADFTTVRALAVLTITRTANGDVVPSASNGAAPAGVETSIMEAGTRRYVVIYERTDNFGQVHRSAMSPAVSYANLGPPNQPPTTIAVPTLRVTNAGATRAAARVAIYRTTDNGLNFYRVSGLTTPLNDPTRDFVYFADVTTDVDLIGNELLYTNGDVLENVAPAAASLIVTYRSRMFLGGFSDGNLLAFSKETFAGDAVAFSDALTLTLDPAGGNITALGTLDDKLLIFKRDRIYALTGDGPTNAGTLDDFGTPIQVAADVGCTNPNSVVNTTDGVMFMSTKGIYMLDRSMQVSYVGAPVEAYNSLTITGSALVPATNQVRFVSASGTCLVYDYFAGQWSVFTNHAALDCDVWRSVFVYVRSDGSVYRENRAKWTDGDAFYRLFAETGWFQFAGQQGYQRCQRIGMLASYRGPHELLVRLGVDDSPAYVQTFPFDAATILGSSTYGSSSPYGSESVYGGPFSTYQIVMQPGPGVQKNQMFRVSVEDSQASNPGEGLAISSLAFQVGVLPKMARVPATRRL